MSPKYEETGNYWLNEIENGNFYNSIVEKSNKVYAETLSQDFYYIPISDEFLSILEELAAQAQELDMGY